VNKCLNGHENPDGRQYCQQCGARIVVVPSSTVENGGRGQFVEIETKLQNAQSENERLTLELATLRAQMASFGGHLIGPPHERAMGFPADVIATTGTQMAVAERNVPAQSEPHPLMLEPDIRSQIERLIGRPVAETENPREVLEEATGQLRSLEAKISSAATATSGHVVSFPATASKMLGWMPQRYQWLVTVIAPLLLGGGSAYVTMPSHGSELSKTQTQLQQAQTQNQKLTDEIAAKTKSVTVQAKELDHLQKDNDRLRHSLTQQGKDVDGQLEKAHHQNTELTTKLADAQNVIVALRTFAEQGFIEWEGFGPGVVNFTPTPSRGRVLEGGFPTDQCFVAAVSGDIESPDNARNKPCGRLTLNVRGKSENKRILILWRRRPS
jgi:hypothetical protein